MKNMQSLTKHGNKNQKIDVLFKKLLKDSMENAFKMSVPLKVELSEASNWYEAK